MTPRDDDADESAPTPTRREFFRRAGLGIAGVAIGGSAGAAVTAAATANPPEFTPLPQRSTPGFDHVVTVMFENRSFDNMLGHLYTAAEKTRDQFDGIPQGSYANEGLDGEKIEPHVYSGSTDAIMQSPQPDPGEHYPHVNTQLFGVVDPSTNADLRANGLLPPFNTPPTSTAASNSGFIRDYCINFENEKGRRPRPEEYQVIMGGFSPAMMPVLSTLAREFAVYDRWHAAVPSQTFCNRLFFHASTSHGYVTNHGGDGYEKWLDGPAAPTIFNRLADAGVSWRVYYDKSQLVSLTGLLHAPVLQPFWKSHFRVMEQFYEDARNGDLPAYSFIEPRMVFNHNDMHPPWGERVRESDIEVDGESVPVYNSALSDVRAGDALLQDIYDAVRTSASPTGSNAVNTALVVTFDEHGGTYDHVPPPSATPPDRSGPGEMGFHFDRLGVRVPAIVVSAYTGKETVIHDEMHHGSVINTLCRQHGLAPLTVRDQTANPLFNAVTLTEPRQPYTWPQPRALYVGRNPEEDDASAAASTHRHRPLTAPAIGLSGLLLARYNPGAKAPRTYAEAYEALSRFGTGLFGTRDDEPAQG
ncbi:alkaline phosphatase family protein [Microbacterium sp. 1.5R]|uniref:alkaline phosphatase family protein n=1 Tax=Microbacterium sp. 1.5R TaxID=1916917 RepID=UPI00119E7094|nr:alkaline phosphatase family protein [Microbacterium sp. 1.5R]